MRVDNLSCEKIIKQINHYLNDNEFCHIVTLNPEIILKALSDKLYKKILNSANLIIADGIGIKFAFWRYGKNLKCRFAGVDLMWKILDIANQKKLKILLVASDNGLSNWQETQRVISAKFPKLQIIGVNLENFKNLESSLISKLNNCDIVFVNFGAPEQEIFLYKISNKTSAKIGIGVGGAFDYITGKALRAPKSVRKIGLEWLYRLLHQPKRVKRIFNAVIVFPFKVLLNKD